MDNDKEYIKRIAENSKAKCLSKEYINKEVELLWECINGHVFQMSPKVIIQLTKNLKDRIPCPYCAQVKKEISGES